MPGSLKLSMKLAIVVRAGPRADVCARCCGMVLPGDAPLLDDSDNDDDDDNNDNKQYPPL